MARIISIIVRAVKDKIYADAGDIELKTGDNIILETDHGIDSGIVYETTDIIISPAEKEAGVFVGHVLRKTTEDDRRKIADNIARQAKCFDTVSQKALRHGLDMKLIRVQYTFDRSKLFVYYTSDSRVDFRNLIKDLGHALKTRIQMVQIGVRDESKIVGGIGICGRQLCCQIFLRDFSSVTIDMAKDQDLSLNISKLSGVCGRLMCCISYENAYYREIKDGLPKFNDIIATPLGSGKFCALDPLKQTVTVEMEINNNKEFKKFTIDEIKKLNKQEPK